MEGGAECERSGDVVSTRASGGILRLRVRPRVVSSAETHAEGSRPAVAVRLCGGVSSGTSAGSTAPIAAT